MTEPDELNPLSLDAQLCFPLYAAARLMVQAYRPFLGEIGLTYPQYLVMLALWESDGLTVKELSGRLLLDSGTLTPLLQRLQKQGLIARVRGERDQRIVRNQLTEVGRRLRSRALSIPEDMLQALELDLDEVVDASATVRRMVSVLARHHGLDRAGGRS